MTQERNHIFPDKGHLEEITKKAESILEYSFKDKTLLITALTHPSAIQDQPSHESYERLEFLGDAFLGLVVSDVVYRRYPDLDEGKLTRLKIAVTSGEALSEIAGEVGFADIIIFGPAEDRTNRRGLHSALENVFEAVIAALYLDGGAEVATEWIMRTIVPKIHRSMASGVKNYKGQLQEVLQSFGTTPVYRVVDEQGPPHDRTFVAEVLCEGEVLGSGSGRTKKEAETFAAQMALKKIDKEPKR